MNEEKFKRPGIDYHVHTKASHDALGCVDEYCDAALGAGIGEIGFVNHLDLDTGLAHCRKYDHAAFAAEVEAARAKFPALRLKVGIEVTHQPQFARDIERYLSELQFDFAMGSIHILGKTEFCISEEAGSEKYFGEIEDSAEAYRKYFDAMAELVRSGIYDVAGHFDLIKRYGALLAGPLESRKFYSPIRQSLEGMIKRDMALEVNASGLYHACRETYPSYNILTLYAELGGRRITVGSDAHEPGDVARGLDRAASMIRLAGFNEITVFDNRTPKQIGLP